MAGGALWQGSMWALAMLLLSQVRQGRLFNLDGSPGAYARFPAWELCRNGSVSLEFKTDEPDALLFYVDNGRFDFFELKLVDGVAKLRYNLGEGTVVISAGHSLNDLQWHKVQVLYGHKNVTFVLDKIEQFRLLRIQNSSDPETTESSNNYFYVGGLPKHYSDRLFTLALPSVVFEPPLQGSVRNLVWSNCGKDTVRPEMLDFEGILSNDEDLCVRGNPCLNGGVCLTTSAGLLCDCTKTAFSGDRCDKENAPSDATFFGAQYISYDLSSRGDPVVSSIDKISMDFRTKQPNGLLFYTGDNGDYINVAVKDGGIIVTINLGSGPFETEVRPNHVRFDDNRWHRLTVKREARGISLEVDQTYKKSGSTTGKFTLLSSNVLYVGGSPQTSQLPGSRVSTNFKGCLRKVVYEADNLSLDLMTMAKQKHSLLDVVGEVIFDKCQELVHSQPVTFTTSEAHLVLPSWDVSERHGSIAFQFQTNEPTGVLLYNTGASTHSDFIAMELLDGVLYFVINFGSTAQRMQVSQARVSDGHPHEVYLDYQGMQGYLTVDGHKEVFTTGGKAELLELGGSLFVGGVGSQEAMRRLPQELWAARLGHGYIGCFQDLVVNGDRVDLMLAARKGPMAGVAEYCRQTDPQCQSYPCMHNGVCLEGWNRYRCDCRATGFIGSVCQTAASILQFDGTQYMKVTMPQESSTQAEDISLRFRTMHPNGLLFLTSSLHSQDAMQLYLEGGSVKLGVDVGSGRRELTVGTVLNDDQWHTVFITRRGQTIELGIDGNRPVTDKLPGQEKSLSTSYIILGSPEPMSADLPGRMDGLKFQDLEIGRRKREGGSSGSGGSMLGQHAGFIGSMQQFVFNQDFFELAKDGAIENIEVTARYSTDEYVIRHPVTFKSVSAYATLPPLQAYKKFSISFQLKTTEADGLLLYNAGRGQDFFAMELDGGFLFYVYNMGDGAERIRANTIDQLNDNKWHEVRLLRAELHKQLLRVDDNTPKVDNLAGAHAKHFDLEGSLFVGGVRKTMYHSLPITINSRHGFVGCLGSLDFNGYLPNLVKEAENIHQSVVEGCKGPTTQCQKDSCSNMGRCVQQWHSFTCDCDMTSFNGPNCEQASTTATFGPGHGLITFTIPEPKRSDTFSDELALGFTTLLTDAVLVRIDSDKFDDYIELELVKGNIFAVYNMGTTNHPIGEHFIQVNDGKYHVVRFTRNGPNSTIQVDDLMMQSKHPRGQQLEIFNHQAFIYLGGRRDKSGAIVRPFEGTMSGVVFNGIKILDLVKAGDPKTESVGNVTVRAPPSKPESEPEHKPDVTGMQSTMGVREKMKKRQIPSISDYWSHNLATHSRDSLDTFKPHFLKKAREGGREASYKPLKLVHRLSRANSSSPQAQLDPGDEPARSRASTPPVDEAAAVYYRHTTPSIVARLLKERYSHKCEFSNTDHLGEDVQHKPVAAALKGEELQSQEYGTNDDTEGEGEEEEADYYDDPEGSGGLAETPREPGPAVPDVAGKTLESSSRGNPPLLPRLSSARPTQLVRFGGRFAVTVNTTSVLPNSTAVYFDMQTTPKLGVTDDIISSGTGPNCGMSDDIDFETDCTSIGSGTESDIITPTVIIEGTPPPPTTTPRPGIPACTGPHCGLTGSGLVTATPPIRRGSTPDYKIPSDHGPPPTGDTKSEGDDSSTMKIGLIVGILAGVLVAVLILLFALYKFRTRDEGTYKVDESQNFAHLESKKPQGNGTVVNSAEGPKRGKKKDVKEWYV